MPKFLDPTYDNVIIEPLVGETQTQGGIFIPDQVKEKPTRGTVIAIGSDVLEITEGDEVIYTKFAGNTIMWEDKTLIVLNERDVLAIVLDSEVSNDNND